MPLKNENKLIEVCSKCLMACCYHGELMCDNAKEAGTELKTVRELLNLGLENNYHWSDENMNRIYGYPAPNGYKKE